MSTKDELNTIAWTSTRRYQMGFNVYRNYADEHTQTTPILRSFATNLARAVNNNPDVQPPSTWVLAELGGGRGHYGKQIAGGIIDAVGPEIIKIGDKEFSILPVQYIPSDIFNESVKKATERFQPVTTGRRTKERKRYYHDVRPGAVGDFNDSEVRARVFDENFKKSYDPETGSPGPDLVTICHSGYFIKDPQAFFTDLNRRMGPNSIIIAPHGDNTANRLATSAEAAGMQSQTLLTQEIHIDILKLLGIDTIKNPVDRHKKMEMFWQEMQKPVELPLNENIPEVDSPNNPYKDNPEFLRGRLVLDFLASGPLETLSEIERTKFLNKIKANMRERDGILLSPCRIDIITPSRAAENTSYMIAVGEAIKATQDEAHRRQTYGMGATGRELRE